MHVADLHIQVGLDEMGVDEVGIGRSGYWTKWVLDKVGIGRSGNGLTGIGRSGNGQTDPWAKWVWMKWQFPVGKLI